MEHFVKQTVFTVPCISGRLGGVGRGKKGGFLIGLFFLVNPFKVMSSLAVNLLTLFLGRCSNLSR